MCETFTAPSWLTFDSDDEDDTEKVRRRMREDVDGLEDAERSLLKAEEYAHANLICVALLWAEGKKSEEEHNERKSVNILYFNQTSLINFTQFLMMSKPLSVMMLSG